MANESLAVLGGPLFQIVDEGFDQVTLGFLQYSGTAVISCIGLYEIGIELGAGGSAGRDGRGGDGCPLW